MADRDSHCGGHDRYAKFNVRVLLHVSEPQQLQPCCCLGYVRSPRPDHVPAILSNSCQGFHMLTKGGVRTGWHGTPAAHVSSELERPAAAAAAAR